MDAPAISTCTYEDSREEIRSIRHRVFIEGQDVPPELEIDGLDPQCTHVVARIGSKPVGTGRIQEDGHIGRVAVLQEFRGRGIGRAIMEALVDAAHATGSSSAWLSSQCHAAEFYRKLGFFEEGEVYKEAGIDHIRMRRKLFGQD